MNLGLLRQVCLPCREEEEDCSQDFGEGESLLSPLRTKDEILVPSQKAKVGSLLAAIAKGESRVPVGYHRNRRRMKVWLRT